MVELLTKATNKTEYDTYLSDATIKIGGTTEKFVPNINASKWGDECFLNINHPDLVGGEKETLIDGKLELTVGNNTHRFYSLTKDKLEYEIVFASRPPTDNIVFNLDFFSGVTFHKQFSLTEQFLVDPDYEGQTLEDYLVATHRPEDKVNSISVWHNKSNNIYKVGMFCRFFRPKYTDALGKWIWADQDVNPITKEWVIYGDKKWLDEAIYPVTLGPTLGYDGQDLSTEHGGSDGNVRGNTETTDGSGGLINTFYATVKAVDGTESNREIKMGVYETSGGDPASQALVEQITFTSLVVSDTENRAATGSNNLSASTDYYVCFINKDQDNLLTFESKSGWQAYNKGGQTYADQMLDPAGTPFSVVSNRAWGVWVDYGGAVGAVVTPYYYTDLLAGGM